VNLTRRRGGAEQDAEKTAEKVKARTSAEGAEDGSLRGEAERFLEREPKAALARHCAATTSLPPLSPCSQVLTCSPMFSASGSASPRLRVKIASSSRGGYPEAIRFAEAHGIQRPGA
jgi:hypothetical protein